MSLTLEQTYNCTRCCRDSLPSSAFYPSQLTRKSKWCKECFRDCKAGRSVTRDYEFCQWPPCGASLDGKRRHAKFCSTSCSMKHWHASNPQAEREYYLRHHYKIEPEQYDAMIISQSGLCAICGRQMPGRSECIDHDHETGAPRGILCQDCNQGLGRFDDDAERLQRATDYLRADAQRVATWGQRSALYPV